MQTVCQVKDSGGDWLWAACQWQQDADELADIEWTYFEGHRAKERARSFFARPSSLITGA